MKSIRMPAFALVLLLTVSMLAPVSAWPWADENQNYFPDALDEAFCGEDGSTPPIPGSCDDSTDPNSYETPPGFNPSSLCGPGSPFNPDDAFVGDAQPLTGTCEDGYYGGPDQDADADMIPDHIEIWLCDQGIPPEVATCDNGDLTLVGAPATPADQNEFMCGNDDGWAGVEDPDSDTDGSCDNGAYTAPGVSPPPVPSGADDDDFDGVPDDAEPFICMVEAVDSSALPGSCASATDYVPLVATGATCDPGRQHPVDQALYAQAEYLRALITIVDAQIPIVDHPAPNNDGHLVRDRVVMTPLDSDIDDDCIPDGYVIFYDRPVAPGQGPPKTAALQTDIFFGTSDDHFVPSQTSEGGAALSAYPQIITLDFATNGANGYNLTFYRSAGRADLVWSDGVARVDVFNVQADNTFGFGNPVDNTTSVPYFYLQSDLAGVLDSGALVGGLTGGLAGGPDDVLAWLAGLPGYTPTPNTDLADRYLKVGWLDEVQSRQDSGRLFPTDFHLDNLFLLIFDGSGIPTNDLDGDGFLDDFELAQYAPQSAGVVWSSNPVHTASTPLDFDGDGFPNSQEDFDYDPSQAFDFQPTVSISAVKDADTDAALGTSAGEGTLTFDVTYANRPEAPNEPPIFEINVRLSASASEFGATRCQLVNVQPVLDLNGDPPASDTFTVTFDSNTCPDGTHFVEVHLIGASSAADYADPALHVHDYTFSPSFDIRNRPTTGVTGWWGGPSDDATNFPDDFSGFLTINLTYGDPSGDAPGSVDVHLRAIESNDPNDQPGNPEADCDTVQTAFGNSPRWEHDCIFKTWTFTGLEFLAAAVGDEYNLTLPDLRAVHDGTTIDDFLDSDKRDVYLQASVRDVLGKTETVDGGFFGIFHNDPLVLSEPVDAETPANPIPPAAVNATADDGTNITVDFRAKFNTGESRQGEPVAFDVHYRLQGTTDFATCALDRQHFMPVAPSGTTNDVNQALADAGLGDAPQPTWTAVNSQRYCAVSGLENTLVPYEYYFTGDDGGFGGTAELRPGGPASLYEIVTFQTPDVGTPSVEFTPPPATSDATSVEAVFNVTYHDASNQTLFDNTPASVTLSIESADNDDFGVQSHAMALAAGESDPVDGLYTVELELPLASSFTFNVTVIANDEYRSDDNSTSTPDTVAINVGTGKPLEWVKENISAVLDDAVADIEAALGGVPLPANYWCAINKGLDRSGVECNPASTTPLTDIGCTYNYPGTPPTPDFAVDSDCDGVHDASDASADPNNRFKVPLDSDGDLIPSPAEIFVDFDLWEITPDGVLNLNGEDPAAPNADRIKSIKILRSPDFDPDDAIITISEAVDDDGDLDSRMIKITFQRSNTDNANTDDPEDYTYEIYLGGAYLDPEVFLADESAASGVQPIGFRVWFRNVLVEDNTLGYFEFVPGYVGNADKPMASLVLGNEILDLGTQTNELGAHQFDVFTDEARIEYQSGSLEDLVLDLPEQLVKAGYDALPGGGNFVSDRASHVYVNRTADGFTYEVRVCKDGPPPTSTGPIEEKFCVVEGETGSIDKPTLPVLGVRDYPQGYEVYLDLRDGSPQIVVPVPLNDVTGGLGAVDGDEDFVPDALEPLVCSAEFGGSGTLGSADGSCSDDDTDYQAPV